MKKIIVVLLIMLMCISGCKSDEIASTNSVKVETNDSNLSIQLDSVIDTYNYKGIACIFYNDEKVYESATGYSDVDSGTVNSSNDVYRIGSLTKQFTATCICILYEDGKLSIDDTIDKYFPNAENFEAVTVYDLLTMTSGIPDYSGSRNKDEIDLLGTYKGKELPFEVSTENSAKENQAVILDWILSQDLRFLPGEKFEYSNSNYFLLAEIIEIVSGEKYEDFLANKIIKPLKLNDTSFDVDRLTAKGYVYDSVISEKDFLTQDDISWILYPGVMYGSADLCSSVDDLYSWISALRDGKIVSTDTFDMMTEKNNFGYAMGFFVNDVACYHSGHLGSYLSYIGFAQQKDFVVITLSNTYSDAPGYGDIGVQLGNVALSIIAP